MVSNVTLQKLTLLVLAEFFPALAYSVRDKRSMINYKEVVRCATKSVPIYAFSQYGCYCSGQGSGRPMDDIDRCCMNHDLCYDMLVDRRLCTRLSRYTDTYDWECVADDSDHDASYAPFLEAIEGMFNVTREQRRFPVCRASTGNCGISLCYCDVQAALCFAKFPSPTVRIPCDNQRTDNGST